MKNDQFNEFMSIFSISQIKKALVLQQDIDVLDIEKIRSDIINEKDTHFNEIAVRLRSVIKTEDLIYKLSNEFMDVSTGGGLPYDKEMTLPTNEKWTNILLLIKTISTLNRIYEHEQLDSPVITQNTLEQLGYTMTIEQLIKLLDVLGDTRINQVDDGIQVKFNAIWSQLPLRGEGYIQYNMNSHQDKIDLALEYLQSIKEELTLDERNLRAL
jgi:hypothetical protein